MRLSPWPDAPLFGLAAVHDEVDLEAGAAPRLPRWQLLWSGLSATRLSLWTERRVGALALAPGQRYARR
ncbi:hypothetical protein BN6_56870 [Saccharothrix espanaensis DSM 44229]|uniref:Uncharacterized protein n=1 Tax=Saccharothrix espanaensis (strain ATCC 51144 / DSM 44229 / JCM 9112 / NBRC 15066 / NRRL 15764) TaxID=1179773 RepID=K0K3P8_SACES|nr:hypothetical protein BN6_56870 [Saccharothrix espanaensis DSM 44229]